MLLAACHVSSSSSIRGSHIQLSLFSLLIAKTTCYIHRLNGPWFWSWDKFFFKFRVAFSASKGTQLQNTYLWYKVEFSWRNDMNIFLISATMKGNKSIYTISFTLPPCSTAFINYFIPSTDIQLDSDNSRMSWVNYWFQTFNISRSPRNQEKICCHCFRHHCPSTQVDASVSNVDAFTQAEQKMLCLKTTPTEYTADVLV